jgi:hypothetical protein
MHALGSAIAGEAMAIPMVDMITPATARTPWTPSWRSIA